MSRSISIRITAHCSRNNNHEKAGNIVRITRMGHRDTKMNKWFGKVASTCSVQGSRRPSICEKKECSHLQSAVKWSTAG